MRRPHRVFKPLITSKRRSEIHDVETSSKKQTYDFVYVRRPAICARKNFKVVRVFACLRSRQQQHLVPPSTQCRPLFCSPIPFKTRNNEDHLCPAPCLRRLGRRLCPSGLQQGAINEATGTENEIGNFRFGVDRREWPSYFAVLIARTKNHGGMLCEQEMLMGSVG